MGTINNKQYSFFYRNGLNIVFLTLFTITLFAQAFTGWRTHNEDLREDVDAAHIETGK